MANTFFKTTNPKSLKLGCKWTIECEFENILNKDGSVSKRSLPVSTGNEIHTHVNGHVRIYNRKGLVSESYANKF